MTPRSLNIAIIGYGVVGQRRRQYIDLHPRLKTIAICDLSFKEDSKKQTNDVNTYGNYKELLVSEELDALFVCLPNNIAAEVTIEGLRKNLHVFCEKPPGRNIQELLEVIEVERERTELKLMYGFNHRYHGSVMKAQEVISSGELGKLINLRGVYGKSKIVSKDSKWRSERKVSGGGILLDQGIHMVDLMRMFAGDFNEYKSFVDNAFWKHDVEDNAYALMKTKAGVVAFLNSSATQWKHRFTLEMSFAKGAIALSGILSGSMSYGQEIITITYLDEIENEVLKEETFKYDEDNSWRDEIEYFAKAILEESPIEQGSSKDAYQAMKSVYNIYCADSIWREKYGLDTEPESIN